MKGGGEATHLFRGAPPVRGWSKYQETVAAWTLCGIKRKWVHGAFLALPAVTEDASQVSCRFCRQLMRCGDKG